MIRLHRSPIEFIYTNCCFDSVRSLLWTDKPEWQPCLRPTLCSYKSGQKNALKFLIHLLQVHHQGSENVLEYHRHQCEPWRHFSSGSFGDWIRCKSVGPQMGDPKNVQKGLYPVLEQRMEAQWACFFRLFQSAGCRSTTPNSQLFHWGTGFKGRYWPPRLHAKSRWTRFSGNWSYFLRKSLWG